MAHPTAPPLPRGDRINALEVRVVNRAERALMFVAPAFFKSTAHLDSSGATYDGGRGRISGRPEEHRPRVALSPSSGEYYCSCYRTGGIVDVVLRWPRRSAETAAT